MVINESALLRAMKEDYKGQGYTVARRFDNLDTADDESVLVLSSGDWLVEIEWKNVPPKVFGLIAQHLKGLPAVGEAFTVKKITARRRICGSITAKSMSWANAWAS